MDGQRGNSRSELSPAASCTLNIKAFSKKTSYIVAGLCTGAGAQCMGITNRALEKILEKISTGLGLTGSGP